MNPEKSENDNTAGSLQAVIDFYKKDVDRTLLRENLKLTVQERFEKFASFMAFVQELRTAGQRRKE
jgi:hypothetical protein